jgi:hypothetical protein
MSEDSWEHLLSAVDALVAAGNEVVAPGFHPTQGGWSCEMAGLLDPEVAASLANADSMLTYQHDELFCRHCWAVILGAEAQSRARARYDSRRSG